MRVVLDTNVVVSGLIWGGTPERLIEAAGDGLLKLVASETLIAELVRILERPKFSAKLALKQLIAAQIVARYRELAETVHSPPVEATALRDPDDAAGFVQNGNIVHFHKRFAMRFAGRKHQAIGAVQSEHAINDACRHGNALKGFHRITSAGKGNDRGAGFRRTDRR